MEYPQWAPPGSPGWPDFLAPPQAAGELGRLASFRILQRLARGGMGVVFLAEDLQLRRPVALKVIRPEVLRNAGAVARFLREGRALAAIRHEHVVAVYGAGEDRGLPYLAMEFLKGITLQDWFKQGCTATLGQILELGAGIARGLEAVHAAGLVHRDIKPSNVWLEAPQGRVKILDFGLVRGPTGDASLTDLGAVVGTPQYMAPEQAGGEQVDHRADLFSLGCILHQLCTGQPPFEGNNPLEILRSMATHTPPSVCTLRPGLPAPLGELISQLLQDRPENRPGTAAETARRLLEIRSRLSDAEETFPIPVPTSIDHSTPGADDSTVQPHRSLFEPPSPGPPSLDSRPPARRRWWTAGAVLALAGAVAGLAILLRTPFGSGAQGRWEYINLEESPADWRIYSEGSPRAECTPSDEPGVMRCSLSGGEPYSNAHFYRNLPLPAPHGPRHVVLTCTFRFPPTTHNNVAGESLIQAVEFTASEWRSGRRCELALQWLNVGSGAPCWRYWNPAGGEARWTPLPIRGELPGDAWHTLQIEGSFHDDGAHYDQFSIDGVLHELNVDAAAAESPGDPDRVAFGVQLDGNARQSPYHLLLDDLTLVVADD